MVDHDRVASRPIAESVSVTLNGKPTDVPVATSVATFLAERNLQRGLVVVELNGTIVDRSAYAETVLYAGDTIEIVHFVGGG